MQFNFKNLNHIIDAQWHTQPDDDLIVCLAQLSRTQMIHFFSVFSSNISVKAFNLTQSHSQSLLSTKYESKTNLMSTNKNLSSTTDTSGNCFYYSQILL